MFLSGPALSSNAYKTFPQPIPFWYLRHHASFENNTYEDSQVSVQGLELIALQDLHRLRRCQDQHNTHKSIAVHLLEGQNR